MRQRKNLDRSYRKLGSKLSAGRVLPALATLLIVSLAATGCDGGATASPGVQSNSTPQSNRSVEGADEVLAVVDGVEIKLADLADQIGDRLGQMDFQYRSQRHQLIDSAMRRLVQERLLEAEARSRGMEPEALVDEIVGDKATVTEEDVRMFYLQNQAQLGGQTFEAIGPQISEYLASQARDSVLGDFAKGLAESSEVDYVLEPFRVDIDIEGAPALGREDAAVTLVEFSDFECPYCQRFTPTLDQIKDAYGDDVRVVFLQFPLREIHPNAQKAAEASLCAHEQGSFWEAHDLYFAEQDRLSVADLEEKAGRMGLDEAAFSTCLSSGRYVDAIDGDVSDGASIGVTGTPAIFVNGRPLPAGAVPFEMVAEIIDDELARAGR